MIHSFVLLTKKTRDNNIIIIFIGLLRDIIKDNNHHATKEPVPWIKSKAKHMLRLPPNPSSGIHVSSNMSSSTFCIYQHLEHRMFNTTFRSPSSPIFIFVCYIMTLLLHAGTRVTLHDQSRYGIDWQG
jgi:hypothetical protein